MRVPCFFNAFSPWPSDGQRHDPLPVGMAGLRHKPRHKNPKGFPEVEAQLNLQQAGADRS
jgi:hypothetical protein